MLHFVRLAAAGVAPSVSIVLIVGPVMVITIVLTPVVVRCEGLPFMTIVIAIIISGLGGG